MIVDEQKVIRRAKSFGYDISRTRRGWVLTRESVTDPVRVDFSKLSDVARFLNSQYLW